MDERQYQNFKKIIQADSREALEKFIAMEIEAQPDNTDFLSGLLKSEFFGQFFERGFIEGIKWKTENKKFVI